MFCAPLVCPGGVDVASRLHCTRAAPSELGLGEVTSVDGGDGVGAAEPGAVSLAVDAGLAVARVLSTGEAAAGLNFGWLLAAVVFVRSVNDCDFSRDWVAGIMDSEAAVTNCSKLMGAVAFVSESDLSCFVDHCNRCWYPGHSNPFCAQFLQPGFVSSHRSCAFSSPVGHVSFISSITRVGL